MKKSAMTPGRLLIPIFLVAAVAPLLFSLAAGSHTGIREYPMPPLLVVLPALAVLAVKPGRRVPSRLHKAGTRYPFISLSAHAIPAAAAILLYSRFLPYPFINLATGHLYNSDTWAAIARARALSASPTLGGIIENAGFRWIPEVILAACYRIGGTSPIPFHIVELALFAVSAGLLSDIAGRLAGNRRAGIFAGLIFALAPAHTVTVHWILGIDYITAGFFFLLSWRMYTVYLSRGNRSALAVSLCFSGAAYFCHEIAFILPVFLVCSHAFIRGTRRSPVSAGIFLVPWVIAFQIYADTGVQLADRGAATLSLQSIFEAYFLILPSNLSTAPVHFGDFPGMGSTLIALTLPALFLSAWIPSLVAGGPDRKFLLFCSILSFSAFLPVHNVVLDPGMKEMKHFYFVSMPVAILAGGLLGIGSGPGGFPLVRRALAFACITFLAITSSQLFTTYGKTADLYFTAEGEFEKILDLPRGTVVYFMFEDNDITGISYLFDDWLLAESGCGYRTLCKEVRSGRFIYFRDGENPETAFNPDTLSESGINRFFTCDPATCVIRDMGRVPAEYKSGRKAPDVESITDSDPDPPGLLRVHPYR